MALTYCVQLINSYHKFYQTPRNSLIPIDDLSCHLNSIANLVGSLFMTHLHVEPFCMSQGKDHQTMFNTFSQNLLSISSGSSGTLSSFHEEHLYLSLRNATILKIPHDSYSTISLSYACKILSWLLI